MSSERCLNCGAELESIVCSETKCTMDMYIWCPSCGTLLIEWDGGEKEWKVPNLAKVVELKE